MRAAAFRWGRSFTGRLPPSTIGFAVLRAEDVASSLVVQPPSTEAPSLGGRLEATSGASLIAGNRVEIELDNGRARRWLLDGIARRQGTACTCRSTWRSTTTSEAPWRRPWRRPPRAAWRCEWSSIPLHGLHGSLGLRNPVLERLGGRPGVELRVLAPITSPPSLQDLKQRDHRKLAVIDGKVALVGGRNLSHESIPASTRCA